MHKKDERNCLYFRVNFPGIASQTQAIYLIQLIGSDVLSDVNEVKFLIFLRGEI